MIKLLIFYSKLPALHSEFHLPKFSVESNIRSAIQESSAILTSLGNRVG